jgi:hypothetical protein
MERGFSAAYSGQPRVASLVASMAPHAEQPTADHHSGYFGGWTLNRELSSSVHTPDGRTEAGAGSGGREVVVPRRPGSVDPEEEEARCPGGAGGRAVHHRSIPEMERTMALLQELMPLRSLS